MIPLERDTCPSELMAAVLNEPYVLYPLSLKALTTFFF